MLCCKFLSETTRTIQNSYTGNLNTSKIHCTVEFIFVWTFHALCEPFHGENQPLESIQIGTKPINTLLWLFSVNLYSFRWLVFIMEGLALSIKCSNENEIYRQCAQTLLLQSITIISKLTEGWHFHKASFLSKDYSWLCKVWVQIWWTDRGYIRIETLSFLLTIIYNSVLTGMFPFMTLYTWSHTAWLRLHAGLGKGTGKCRQQTLCS